MPLDTSIYDNFPSYPFRRPPEMAGAVGRHPVAIVGAGPVGLTLAIGLARHGVGSVVIEPRRSVSFGSRAICISRRSLEIWDRFGIAKAPLAKGLAWTGGRSFWRDNRLVLEFAMPHDADEKHPPMINLAQCSMEQFLIDAASALPEIDLRWQSAVREIDSRADGLRLRVATPDGDYDLMADYAVACDGARSPVRAALGLELHGTSYEGRYLIADIRLASEYPTERRAWFDPPSNPGSTVLMHRQPDDIWRIDYQLRDGEDPEAEQHEERVRARIDAHLAMIGERAPYELVWISLYKAHALTLDRYRHGRVLFAGDAAHLLPIFGVRGLNSGLDDAANLAWKLAAGVKGLGGEALLDSYSQERVFAAQENIRQARKSTLFMTPPGPGHALMREAALSLAVSQEFARPLVNPRQTTAITYQDTPLSTPDREAWSGGPAVGATLPNAPVVLRRGNAVTSGYFLDIAGTNATLYLFLGAEGLDASDDVALSRAAAAWPLDVVLIADGGYQHPRFTVVSDTNGRAAARLAGAPGAAYLVRPDGHVAARWRRFAVGDLAPALARVYGRPLWGE